MDKLDRRLFWIGLSLTIFFALATSTAVYVGDASSAAAFAFNFGILLGNINRWMP